MQLKNTATGVSVGLCLFLIATLQLAACDEGASHANVTDLLHGKGFFANLGSFGEWHKPEKVEVELITGTDETFIKVLKSEIEEVSFEEGFTLEFEETKPKHLRFHFSATNVDTEQANLRLKNSEHELTAVSFRCGNAGFIRVNDNQMVDFYNASLSEPKDFEPKWRKIDILLDWDVEQIHIYLDDAYSGSAGFYHDHVESVDELMIYNLNPDTVSFFKDIELCEEYCEGFSAQLRLAVTSLTSILIIVFLLFA